MYIDMRMYVIITIPTTIIIIIIINYDCIIASKSIYVYVMYIIYP